uniref:CRISPR type III-associated protein domain-containing protein n=1 Tax=Archaeoglobus fulgidus TaxID=2234 RepID=A0A7C3RDW5_ARCFL
MKWHGDIDVRLKIKTLRVGGVEQEEDVDLGTVPAEYTASSIKGLLRKAAKRVSNSLGIKGFDREIFGDADSEGRIQIIVKSTPKSEKEKRYGVKIDPSTSSVKSGHLFSYNFLTLDELCFTLRPLLGFKKDEAEFLFYALNYLRYETLGGFGSRGIGLIEDVEICEDFLKFLGVKK